MPRLCAVFVACLISALGIGDARASAEVGDLVYQGRAPDFALAAVGEMVVSPDGKHVYTAGGDGSLTALDRTDSPARPTLIEVEHGGVDDPDDPGGIVDLRSFTTIQISPDGRHLYTGGDSRGIGIFERDPDTGEISWVGLERGDPEQISISSVPSIAISPDGGTVYAGSSRSSVGAVIVLARDPDTGSLTITDWEYGNHDDPSDDGGEVPYSSLLTGIALSADGSSLYSGSSSNFSLMNFEVSNSGREISYVDRVRIEDSSGWGTFTVDMVGSGDGRFLYVAAGRGLAVFARDPGTGSLTQVQLVETDIDPSRGGGLRGATGPALGPGDRRLFVASYFEDAVISFSRNEITGLIALGEVERNEDDDPLDPGSPVDGIDGANDIAFSPDRSMIYVPGFFDFSMGAFSLDGDDRLSFLARTPEIGGGGTERLRLSPDGRFSYSFSFVDRSLLTLELTEEGSGLRRVDIEIEGRNDPTDSGGPVDDLGPSFAVAQEHVYVFTDSGTTVFDRNPEDGSTSFDRKLTGPYLGGIAGAALSATETELYAPLPGEDALAVFARDAATGDLSLIDLERHGVDDPDDEGGPVERLSSPGMAALAGEETVYVTAYKAVSAFARDPASGELSFVDSEHDFTDDPSDPGSAPEGLYGSRDIAISPDLSAVYVSSNFFSDAIVAFDRNPSGELSYTETEFAETDDPDDPGPLVPRLGPGEIEVSHDGRQLYVTSSNPDLIAVFDRDPGSSELSYRGFVPDNLGSPEVDGLHGARSLAQTDEGRRLIVGAYFDSSVSSFLRVPDTTPPDTAITRAPDAGQAHRPGEFEFRFDTPVPDFIAGFECAIDGDGFEACESPLRISLSSPGTHLVEVRAIDLQGNRDRSPARSELSIADAGTPGPGEPPESGGSSGAVGVDLSVKRKAKVRGGRLAVRVAASCDRLCDVRLKGRVIGERRRYPLRTKTRNDESGDQTLRAKVWLRGGKAKQQRRTRKLLRDQRRGFPASARIVVRATGADGTTNRSKSVRRIRIRR